jgi:hypothetical protein
MRRLMIAAVCALLLPVLAQPAAADKPPRTFYGVVPQAPLSTSDYARMGAGNVGILRIALLWPAVDPSALPTDSNWAEYDEVVRQAAQQGIEVLPTVYETPGWVSQMDDCHGQDCIHTPPQSLLALAAWRGFLAEAVNRYGPNGSFWAANPDVPKVPIHVWQIWNEQNSVTYYSPKPNVGDYAKLLTESSKAIKTADPNATVILGGMFGTPGGGKDPDSISAWSFLGQLYARDGIKESFDGVAVHPYSQSMRGVKYQVRKVRQQMQQAGDGQTGMWITEIGWASAGVKHPLNRGPKGQAKRLKESFSYFKRLRGRLGIQTVDWYAWRDANSSAGVCEWCPKAGLFTKTLVPKPSWDAFTSFTGGH